MSVLGDVIERVRLQAREDRLAFFRGMSSHHALRLIADHYDLDFEDVLEAFWSYSDGALNLLDTPRGWTLLGEMVATSCGLSNSAAPLVPSIN